MNTKKRIKILLTLAAIAMAPFSFTITPTQAALVIYEPFDYAAGVIDGSQAGGTGFSTSGWTTSGGDGLHSVITPGLTFDVLSTQGNALQRNDKSGNSETHRLISAASQTALTADNSTIWFSLLVDTATSNPKNNNLTFLFGTDTFADLTAKPPTITGGGEGLGISFLMNISGASLTALTVDDGTSSRSTGMIGPFLGNDLLFIAGKIDWAAGGSDDTLTVYNITDPAAALPAPFATMTADLDQSQFDTLAIGDKQVAVVDEIRFGTTFAEILGGNADPNAPSVDAGDSWITWSGQAVQMDPTITEPNDSDWTSLTYEWTTDAPAGYTVTWDPSNNVEAPAVTITKDAPVGGDGKTVVTVTLAVNNAGNPPEAAVTDEMSIDLYDDTCLAAEGAGTLEIDPTDLDANCITNLKDFAILALDWLNDYAITAPVVKP